MITINRNVLKSALSNALKSINTSAALPVLACVLVSVEGQRLRLATTDLVTTFEQWIPLGSMALEEMAIAVPARLFADMVAQAPVGDITLKIDTKKHEMTC